MTATVLKKRPVNMKALGLSLDCKALNMCDRAANVILTSVLWKHYYRSAVQFQPVPHTKLDDLEYTAEQESYGRLL